MTEIPEHLLQRSKERRKALGLPVEGEEGGEAAAPAAAEAAPTEAAPAAESAAPADAGPPAEDVTTESGAKIPAHLLERAKRRKAAAAGGAGAAVAGGAAAATATLPAPTTTGPGGHTQRLLTVVKSGSIQQTRGEAQDKVHTWPHQLVI